MGLVIANEFRLCLRQGLATKDIIWQVASFLQDYVTSSLCQVCAQIVGCCIYLIYSVTPIISFNDPRHHHHPQSDWNHAEH